MNEEEKEEIELDIEAKYADKTEKEFLSRVTYAECLYILKPENKYCDEIKELSLLKLCEIIEKDKIIDLLIKKLYTKAHISTRCYLQTSTEECMKYKNCYECLKKHFEKKAKGLK